MIGKAFAVGLLVLGLLPAPATAHEEGLPAGDGLIYHNCHELLGFQKVAPPERVRPFVPEPYGLDPDGDGLAAFYVSTRFCERITVGGVEVPNAIDSHISVFIDPPKNQSPPPHASSIVPGVPLEVYLVQWVTNNQAHATWLKQGTGLGEKVKLVSNLVYDYNPVPGHDHVVPGAVDEGFRLEVPSPAPSPFRIEAEVHEPTGSALVSTIAENWWAETDEGTVIIHAEALRGASSVSAPARAKGTITSEDPHSPLGQMFGDRQTRSLCSGSDGEPDATCPEGVGDPVASSFLTGVQLTKCVRKAPGDCVADNH